MQKQVSFLLLSGGIGSRSRHYEPKQFYKINGLEMLCYSLMLANAHERITEIITNAPAGFEERTRVLCEKYAPAKSAKILQCGDTRQESVRILASAAQGDAVILHEAARPMISRAMIDELLASNEPNAGLFSAVPFSMCSVDLDTGMVARDVPRKDVFNIQLPQKFDRSTLLSAHQAAADAGREFTEDAILVKEMTGANVRAIAGHGQNIKVTSPEDFGLVEKLLQN
ncbi:IspD/TarI family cytidylyltransferase [Leisingera caerulea]|uniref:IspD/TarI family cytidylyltransferase n=1 Tax=Leisingera caerulea TaxID=506591 RepID=UPI0004256930|nr:2-C-methyl-D-erythritol 4-phosphate cytidylyltransferase [Leisingera caerulea]